MTANVGSTDIRIRWVLAVVFFTLAVVLNAQPILALVMALMALVLAGTALTQVCPFYTLLGINTAMRHHAHPSA